MGRLNNRAAAVMIINYKTFFVVFAVSYLFARHCAVHDGWWYTKVKGFYFSRLESVDWWTLFETSEIITDSPHHEEFLCSSFLSSWEYFVKIVTFSEFVVALMFPNPMVVKLLIIKYNEVMYLDFRDGPLAGSDSLYNCLVCCASWSSHPICWWTYARSTFPMAYHMQHNQWAMSKNVANKSMSTAAPYSEYLSSFRATLTNRKSRAVFNKPISVVVWKAKKQQQFFW